MASVEPELEGGAVETELESCCMKPELASVDPVLKGCVY